MPNNRTEFRSAFRGEAPCGSETAGSTPPPLSPNVRRHIGQSLRTLYADILAESPGTRIEGLLARLGKSRR